MRFSPESIARILKARQKPGLNLLTAISVFFAFVVLCVLSILLLYLSDKTQPAGMGATRYLARLQAPLTATEYRSTTRDQITILMYDSSMLSKESLAWPLQYGEQALWLQKAAGDGMASQKPKALFVDITFGQERQGDDSILELRDALCRIQNDWGVPVFLAGLISPRTGELQVRSNLQADVKTGKPCFTLVGVDNEPDPVDGFAWDYPLYKRLIKDERGIGKFENGPPFDASQKYYRSAALAIAQDAGKFEAKVENESLALMWGIDSATGDTVECTPGNLDKLPKIFAFWSAWKTADNKRLCTYHRSGSISQLNEISEDKVQNLLKDKFVIVAAQVVGYNDWVNSPIHGSIPGVNIHAMALDNLLTYNDKFKLSHEWGELFKHGLSNHADWELIFPAIICIFALIAADLLWRKVFAFTWVQSPVLVRLLDKAKNPFQGGRGWLIFMVRIVAWPANWVIRLIFRIALTTLLIMLFQMYFRIGMLPVIELIGMTLVLESFEVLEKLTGKLEGVED